MKVTLSLQFASSADSQCNRILEESRNASAQTNAVIIGGMTTWILLKRKPITNVSVRNVVSILFLMAIRTGSIAAVNAT